jgi:hypothetical protein
MITYKEYARSLGNLNLQKIQQGDQEEFKKVFQLFGCRIEDRETFEDIKFYSFEPLLPKQYLAEPDEKFRERAFIAAEEIIEEQLRARGWRYREFGPDKKGNGFMPPKFRDDNYDTGCIWIFQPYCEESAGSLSPAYNLLWTVSHELAHAETNDLMTRIFGGQGKRRGALGIETRGNTFSAGMGRQSSLSLVDALRATEWEHHSTILQREIIEQDYGLTVTDEQFLGEYQYNMAGSVIRTLWGQFTTPGHLGVIPEPGNLSGDEMNLLAQDLYRGVALEMGLAMNETY